MKEFHDGKKGKKADLAQWDEGFKLQGPTYGVTTHMVYFSPIKFRTLFRIMAIMKKWYLSLLLMNIHWGCCISKTAPIENFSKGNNVHALILLYGIT